MKNGLVFGKVKLELFLFFLLISLVAFGLALSDSIYSNYYNEVYNVTTMQRSFIEFPRELPGVLCVFIISGFSFLGDVRLAFIAQILSFIGITVLGLCTPTFAVMLIFLFINSLGMHLFMPLQDSIGMSLAEPGQVGKRVGQYGSTKTAVAFFAGIFVFIGFKVGFFSFDSSPFLIFNISAVCFLLSAIVAFLLFKTIKYEKVPAKKKFKLLFRKEYKFYYILTILSGVQKQIAYVFGSWVIIDMLFKGADTMSLLIIISSLLCVFFFKYLGGWIDKKGIKFMMYLDALSFIVVYVIYGFVVWYIYTHTDAAYSWLVFVIYGLFILDRLSMQIGVIKAIYLKSIAVKQEEVTTVLSTGISLDHVVAIVAAQVSGLIWTYCGPQWVFFLAAFISIGNLIVARMVKEPNKNLNKG